MQPTRFVYVMFFCLNEKKNNSIPTDTCFFPSQDEYNLNPGLEWEDEFTGRWLFRLALTDYYYYYYLAHVVTSASVHPVCYSLALLLDLGSVALVGNAYVVLTTTAHAY